MESGRTRVEEFKKSCSGPGESERGSTGTINASVFGKFCNIGCTFAARTLLCALLRLRASFPTTPHKSGVNRVHHVQRECVVGMDGLGGEG